MCNFVPKNKKKTNETPKNYTHTFIENPFITIPLHRIINEYEQCPLLPLIYP